METNHDSKVKAEPAEKKKRKPASKGKKTTKAKATGTREEVFAGLALKTTGRLSRRELFKCPKDGKIKTIGAQTNALVKLLLKTKYVLRLAH